MRVKLCLLVPARFHVRLSRYFWYRRHEKHWLERWRNFPFEFKIRSMPLIELDDVTRKLIWLHQHKIGLIDAKTLAERLAQCKP